MADRVGQQLGNYRLIRLLGRGSFAEVYLGEHIHLETEAAIKVLHTQLASEDVEQFRAEARLIARLIHPHIVRVLDFGLEGATPFLVMDHAPGGTLRKRHPKGTRLPIQIVVSYVKQIAPALQHAHERRLIHRDIKPENLLIGRTNEILLSDFGIALVTQSSRYQSTQDMAGTIAYMAPEQIEAHPRPASDQYSLGIVVYEWLSGDRPFHGSFTEIAVKHSLVPPPSLREKLPTLPLAVEHVVMTALAKDPKQRWASMQAFATALEQASQTETIPLSPSIPPTYDIRSPGPPQQPIELVTRPGELFIPTEVSTLASQMSSPTEQVSPTNQKRSSPNELATPVNRAFPPREVALPSKPPQRAISRRAVVLGLAGLAGAGVAGGGIAIFSRSQAGTPSPAETPTRTGTQALTNLGQSQTPIKIGISLSLSGDFSADGMALQQGYQLWADTVNKSGGVLGRQVTLDILSDASSTTQVAANYQKLITIDHVDVVFGPFSTLLTKPASLIASRYGYAMIEGAGGAPSVFTQGLHNLFDVSPSIANLLVSFTQYLLSLPSSQRPATAAYATEDDPFTQPQVDTARQYLERGGIKTVSFEVYPAQTTDYTSIAQRMIASRADVIVAGTLLPDIVAYIQSFRQQHYNPKAIIATSGPDQGSQFANAIGGTTTAEGVFVPNSGWYPSLNTFQNTAMVSDYVAKYGGTADGVSSDVAEAFAVGQVFQQAATKINSIDNTKLIAELHSGDTFQTVQGPVKFNDQGENVLGIGYLFQWQNGSLVSVYPPSQASAVPEYPKPSWP